jgi:hypothetical protein
VNNSSQYIKFFRNLAILIAILFICDRGIGYILGKQYYKQTHGDAQTGIYLLEHANEDVIIMGSSRASHHYNATLLERETGLTAFNGGRDEMVISYIEIMLDQLYKRNKPKFLILDITPHEISESHDIAVINQRVSTNLLPFLYKYPQLANTIDFSDNHEVLKSKISHIYPYNSQIAAILQNAYTNFGHKTIKGYEPLYGNLDPTHYTVSLFGNGYPQQYPVYKRYEDKLKETLNEAKNNGVKVIAIVSPFYFPLNNVDANNSYKRMKEIFAENNIPFYDFSADSTYLQNTFLFRDDVHLNDSGATIFSKQVSTIVKNNL